MKKILLLNLIISLWVSISFMQPAVATEPNITDYTAYPIFMVQAVKPNIMIILDNSGSMNYNAYGSWPGNGQEVTDELFVGEPYNQVTRTIERSVSASEDDAEEVTTAGDLAYSNNPDLDLGGFDNVSNNAVVGIRFQDISIPMGSTIVSAYIEFEAYVNSTTDTSITIVGENSDNAAVFENSADNISSRPATTASVTWSSIPDWTVDSRYETPELKTIVQEIVNRSQWSEGNALAFRFTGTGKRDAKSYDSEGAAHSPMLHVEFKLPEATTGATKYYGYFNPD